MDLGTYTLGSNEAASTVLSLKANSRLIRDLSSASDATIEFTSHATAKVTVGQEEYDLTFCEVNPTVSMVIVQFVLCRIIQLTCVCIIVGCISHI